MKTEIVLTDGEGTQTKLSYENGFLYTFQNRDSILYTNEEAIQLRDFLNQLTLTPPIQS